MKCWVFLVFVACLTFLPGNTLGQSPKRLQAEVDSLRKKYDTLWQPGKETYVFTGSSSIRFWDSLPALFPNIQVVNSGFGGSMASDLWVYLDKLVLDFKPSKVFIYEGDNDIFEKKTPAKIVRQIRRIVRRIQEENGPTPVVIIGVKPSIERWHLKKKYEKLNHELWTFCHETAQAQYVHIWDAMLDKGAIREEFYLEDGLHMNEKGYKLWEGLIWPYRN